MVIQFAVFLRIVWVNNLVFMVTTLLAYSMAT